MNTARRSASRLALLALLSLNAAACAAGGDNAELDPEDDGSAAIANSSIAIKASATKSALGSSVSASLPGGTKSGDYLVAQVVFRGASGDVTPPDASWKLLARESQGSDLAELVFGRAATSATAGGGTWKAPSGAKSITVSISDLSGVATHNPVRTTAATGGARDIHFATPKLTGLSAGDLALVFVASSGGPRPWADKGTLLGLIPSGSIPARYVDQKTLHTFEGMVGRKLAYGHSWLPWDFRNGFPAASTGTGPESDWSDGRMSWFSWPQETTWPDGGANGDGDPIGTLTQIINGDYDALLAGNAEVLKTWGQPSMFRLFCEMNGGDHPWEIGHQTHPALTATNYSSAFVKAWKRIWYIFKGDPTDAASHGFGDIPMADFAHADNVLFHWNPQTYETTHDSRDTLYPGDQFVDAVGTELYVRGSSDQSTLAAHLTNTNSGNGSHLPLYETYGPGGSRNQGRLGLMGNGEGGNGGIVDGTDSFVDPKNGLSAFPGWKFFTYWDGGTSTVDSHSLSHVKTFMNDAWMNPVLEASFDVPAAFSAAYQARLSTGLAAGANYGAEQIGVMLLGQGAKGGSVAGVTVDGFGYGAYGVVAIALEP